MFFVGFTWEMIVHQRIIPWFRVDSASNPGDGLSRDAVCRGLRARNSGTAAMWNETNYVLTLLVRDDLHTPRFSESRPPKFLSALFCAVFLQKHCVRNGGDATADASSAAVHDPRALFTRGISSSLICSVVYPSPLRIPSSVAKSLIHLARFTRLSAPDILVQSHSFIGFARLVHAHPL